MSTNDDCKNCNCAIFGRTEMLCICNIDASPCEKCIYEVIQNGGCEICAHYLNISAIVNAESNESIVSIHNKFKIGNPKTSHIITAANWFNEICKSEKWKLNEPEKLKILGIIPSRKYECLLSGNFDEIPSDELNHVVERLSILITIFKYLYALVGTDYSYSLFNRPNSNPVFGGKSIKEMLLASDSTEQFYTVRKYLIETAHY